MVPCADGRSSTDQKHIVFNESFKDGLCKGFFPVGHDPEAPCRETMAGKQEFQEPCVGIPDLACGKLHRVCGDDLVPCREDPDPEVEGVEEGKAEGRQDADVAIVQQFAYREYLRSAGDLLSLQDHVLS